MRKASGKISRLMCLRGDGGGRFYLGLGEMPRQLQELLPATQVLTSHYYGRMPGGGGGWGMGIVQREGTKSPWERKLKKYGHIHIYAKEIIM
jgi:hypothetical protein